MSLDVSLESPETFEEPCRCQCGHEHTYTRRIEHFEWNVTHNLNTMASAAGIYEHLWHPERLDIKTGQQLIEPLTKGLELLRAKPYFFKQYNPANGWGTYEHLVEFVAKYLAACKEFPEAIVVACP